MKKLARRALVLLLVVAVVVVVVGLIPPSFVYDPAPLVAALRASASLPIESVPAPVNSVTLRDARVVGSDKRVSIRIEGGVITAIDDVAALTSAPPPATVIELDGAFVMPGLIDAHVHLSMAPGAAVRGDDAALSAQLRAHHLRAYLASGVTTILDPAVDGEVAGHVQRHLAAGHAGPRYLHLGPPFVVEDGYVADLFPTPVREGDVSSVDAHLDRLRAARRLRRQAAH